MLLFGFNHPHLFQHTECETISNQSRTLFFSRLLPGEEKMYFILLSVAMNGVIFI